MPLSKDFLGGVLFFLVGLGIVAVAWSYPLGSAMRMGPGYFPMMVGVTMTALGLGLAVSALRQSGQAGVSRVEIRPIVFILAAIAAFSMLIEPAGLIVAVMALVLISRLARPEGGPIEVGALAAALVAIAYVVFRLGLNMPLPVVPW